MRAYVGQTRSRALIERLRRWGIGECTNRGEWPPRRAPFFLDNGAYKDWRAGAPWDRDAWLRDVERAERLPFGGPEFLVAPDLVGAGMTSLAHSLHWLPRVSHLSPYLAVQDGMEEAAVLEHAPRFAGIFVGGTTKWKLATGADWVRLAHRLGLPCHVGRVGTPKRVAWAREIGADSIDSCFPLFTRGNMDDFLRALHA